MRRSRFHPVLTWLCLIWFGLTSTLLTGGMVVCRDGHGGTRVEWGCDQNGTGECLTSCGSETEGDSGIPHPCQDTPIEGEQQVTKAAPRTTSDLSKTVAVTVAALVLWLDPPTPTNVAWSWSGPDRPPDLLRHIRTVVLLV